MGGQPVVVWSREETPDITTGVQHLEVQVHRNPYDGTFDLVAQAQGSSLTVNVHWWAST